MHSPDTPCPPHPEHALGSGHCTLPAGSSGAGRPHSTQEFTSILCTCCTSPCTEWFTSPGGLGRTLRGRLWLAAPHRAPGPHLPLCVQDTEPDSRRLSPNPVPSSSSATLAAADPTGQKLCPLPTGLEFSPKVRGREGSHCPRARGTAPAAWVWTSNLELCRLLPRAHLGAAHRGPGHLGLCPCGAPSAQPMGNRRGQPSSPEP